HKMARETKAIKILVVDDEPDLQQLILQKFRNKIKAKEYEFSFAENGTEALSKIADDQTINLILTDINMPRMDGLTLLEKIKELNKPLLKSIIVSAYGDMENIRTAMNRGAFDFVTKPINFTDLETTISKTLMELSILKNALQNHDEYIALQQELNIARNIQLSILPKFLPETLSNNGFEINAAIETAKEVGGDFYDYFTIDNDRVGFLIGDVSGKGIPAAIFMAVSKTTLKATALRGLPANECLQVVNNVLFQESLLNVFVTAFYGVLNIHTGELAWCNAGHNPPWLISGNGEMKMLREGDGIPMGFIQNSRYSIQTHQFKEGEILFLYTDGVTEAMDEAENEFSDENLEKTLTANAHLPLPELNRAVFREVRNHTRNFPQSDDITVLSLRYSHHHDS
ncbi:MAG: SpoIIE family protein phosphatase, partial [Calditrichia bacterium]